MALPVHRVIGHKEYARGRKSDPQYDMDWKRGRVAAFRGGPPAPAPAPAPAPTPPPPPAGGLPSLSHGERSNAVRRLQEFMTRTFPSYNRYTPTGFYGDVTAAGIREFQRRVGITGPDADGTRVGPRTNAALWRFGYRG